MGKYDDIIGLPHHQSQTRPHMSMHDRAGQFAPFAALTGFGASVTEASRTTDEKPELEEDRKALIDRRLQMILSDIRHLPEITVTYFQPDSRKNGGASAVLSGRVREMDALERKLVFTSGKQIPWDSILSLDGPLFRSEEEENTVPD